MKSEKIQNDLSRRKFIKKSLLGLGGAGLGFFTIQSLSCNSKSKLNLFGSKPNILLIVADDAGWHDVGYHESEIKTPAIDNLVKTGAELNQFYVCPTCSPTRASLLTGRPASRFGILGPIAGKSKQVLPLETLTLAQLLRDWGYATAITGKWHLGLRQENGPHKYGFEYTYGYLHGQIDPYTHRYKFGDLTWHRNNVFIEEEGHATDLITNEAVQYIKNYRDKNKPFFLYVPYSVPHTPIQEEEKWLSIYKDSIENESRRSFAASVTHMDYAISQLIQTLDDERLRENTLVIFFSDNGAQENWINVSDQYDGRHGPNDRLGDNRPLRDWKGSLYEGGIRVPAVFNWPGKIKTGMVNEIISAIDILPTLASLAGKTMTPQAEIEGANIWKAVSDATPLVKRTLYWRTREQFALRKGNWKLVYTGTLEKGNFELFNLTKDPKEEQDVAKDNHEIVNAMLEELKIQTELDSI
jgi:arylsulfatase B